jgi:uncharacterized protein (TIGR00369 family)
MSLEFKNRIPFVELLGLELLRFESGEAELALTPRDEHVNGLKMVHGGVVMTLLDVAMAHAARSPRRGDSAQPRGVLTVEMKTSFMRPGIGRLVARGKVLTQTQRLSFCEASLFDADEKLVAHATGTFKLLRAVPAGSRAKTPIDGSD